MGYRCTGTWVTLDNEEVIYVGGSNVVVLVMIVAGLGGDTSDSGAGTGIAVPDPALV